MISEDASVRVQTQDLTGQKFERLEPLWPCCRITKSPQGCVITQWVCLCDCGETVVRSRDGLKSGKALSCGCLQRERKITHGLTVRSREGGWPKVYRAWHLMKNRCLNPRGCNWADYGGRGITIHESWVNDFEQFYRDMGDPPTPKHTLDRIRVNEGYGPGNCRWATRKEQNNNKRSNRLVEFNGETKNMAQWSELLGIGYDRLKFFLNKGMTMEEIIQKENKCKATA